jgi:hypothetical protein
MDARGAMKRPSAIRLEAVPVKILAASRRVNGALRTGPVEPDATAAIGAAINAPARPAPPHSIFDDPSSTNIDEKAPPFGTDIRLGDWNGTRSQS